MLNPLLHTSNSAPTSPVCTRSAAATAAAGGGYVQSILASSLMSGGARASGRNGAPAGAANVPENSGNKQRRLSRLVKTRTLDFTEFPEGMREYSSGSPGFKAPVRESRSQPGSPAGGGSPVPRIRVQDFGARVGTVGRLVTVHLGSEVSTGEPRGKPLPESESKRSHKLPRLTLEKDCR